MLKFIAVVADRWRRASTLAATSVFVGLVLVFASLVWFGVHALTSQRNRTAPVAEPAVKPAIAPPPPAVTPAAAFDPSEIPGLRMASMGYAYPRKCRSIRDCDIENLELHLFDDAGKPTQKLHLKHGIFRHKAHGDSLEVSAAPVEYLTAEGAAGPEYALLVLSADLAGAVPSREGMAQVFQLSDQRLSVVQELKWDEQFEAESVSQYWSFDAPANTLTVNTVHRLPNDAPCCASEMDVVTLRWNGSAFAGESMRTELLRGKSGATALSATGPQQTPKANDAQPTPALDPRHATPAPPVPPPGSGPRVALVIGNNLYAYLPALNTATSDAQGIERLLKNDFGFETELIVDGTREQIVEALNRYRRRLGGDTSFLLYYAGHGYFDKEAATAYWLPVDAKPDTNTNWISAEVITADLRAMRARHILVIADSCYSGALSREAPIRTEPTGNRPRYIDNLRRHGPSRTLLASGGDEPVSDGGGGAHSVFADALLKGLVDMPFKQFSAEELFAKFIQESVAGRSGQVPECSPLRNSGHDSGSFVFERGPVR